MIGGVALAGVVLGSVVAQTGYRAFEKQVSETQGELTADSKDALPDQKTIEANKKKNETERKKEERQEQEDEKEAEITISVDEATPVDLDSYVQIQPVSSKASSELDDNTAEKAIDGQEATSWQENVAGYGHGENLTLKFEKTYTVKYLALKLGSWKDVLRMSRITDRKNWIFRPTISFGKLHFQMKKRILGHIFRYM